MDQSVNDLSPREEAARIVAALRLLQDVHARLQALGIASPYEGAERLTLINQALVRSGEQPLPGVEGFLPRP